MLILHRRVNERIMVGDDPPIVIEIIDIRGGAVRVGITASDTVPIFREEVYLERKQEQRDATSRQAEGGGQPQKDEDGAGPDRPGK